MKHRLPALFVPILLSACASQGDFPSLAPRPYEKTGSAPAAVPAPVMVESNAATLARIDAAVALAQGAQGPFDTALASARRAVAGADRRMGSESWIAAQLAISRLERERAPVQTALATLDAEMRGLLMGPPSADRAALEAALGQVGAMDEAQRAVMTSLIEQVRPR